MSYGPIKVYTGTIASGASTLTSISLDKSYSKIYAEVSTMSTGAALLVYGSTDGSTFRPVYERVNTASVQWTDVYIGTACTNGITDLNCNFPYIQFRASAVIDGGASIKLICVD